MTVSVPNLDGTAENPRYFAASQKDTMGANRAGKRWRKAADDGEEAEGRRPGGFVTVGQFAGSNNDQRKNMISDALLWALGNQDNFWTPAENLVARALVRAGFSANNTCGAQMQGAFWLAKKLAKPALRTDQWES